MWGFWWIFPLIGLAFCLFFIVLMVRAMGGGDHGSDEASELRREVRELREELNRLKGVR